MKLYVVRHGETDWNKEKLFQGDTDIPLNDAGRIQALKIKEELKNRRVDLCFSSPLIRAKETAEIITNGEIPVNISSLITERNLGIFEGQKINDQLHKGGYWDYELNLSDNGVESIQNLFKRVLFFLNYISRTYSEESILIVSHGSTIRAMNYLITGFSEDEKFLEFDVRNCHVFEYNL